MGRNSRKAHLIGGLAMGGKTSSNLVEHIQAAVLLIHGEKDRTAPLEQVQRLCAKLRSAGKNCELLIIPGAGHVFNNLAQRSFTLLIIFRQLNILELTF